MTSPRFAPVAAFLACVSANADTVQLAIDLNPGPSYLAAYKGEIYFRSNSALQKRGAVALQRHHCLDPALNDAAADRDGDGVSNGAEFTAGTDLSSPPSVFRALLDGTFRLAWPSVPGKTYLVGSNTGTGWAPFQTVSAE